ncbi:hypothetical protein AVEN_46117-1, partial [Araneus ventricosus]
MLSPSLLFLPPPGSKCRKNRKQKKKPTPSAWLLPERTPSPVSRCLLGGDTPQRVP